MNQSNLSYRNIIFAGLLGALGGGLLAILITRAIPKVMARMMKSWMASMKDENGNPVDT